MPESAQSWDASEANIGAIGDLISTVAVQMPLLDAQREGIEMYAAPRFSEFELFQPGELALTRIIADLLDPRGIHGQGTLFLNCLLRSIGLRPVPIHGLVRVMREAPTSIGRRIDLLIETADVLLGVENKPTAVQQPNQLGHYNDELKMMAGSRASCLVFLSDQAPRSALGEVMCIPFAIDGANVSLASILAAALPSVKAPRIREFVSAFIAYLNEHFGDGAVISDSNEPYLDAVRVEFQSTSERRRAIAAVLLAQEEIHEASILAIGDAISSKIMEYASDSERISSQAIFDELDERHGLWGFRRPHWPKNCAVGLSSEGDLDGLYFGIWAPSSGEVVCRARTKIERAASTVPTGRRSKFWPWWKSADPNTLDIITVAQLILESPGGLVGQHKDVEGIAASLIALMEAIDNCLD